jgi:hypothetical protein
MPKDMRLMFLKAAIFIALLSFPFLLARADNVDDFAALLKTCQANFDPALMAQRNSLVRKTFEEDMKTLLDLSRKIQADLNAKKIQINILSDLNCVKESYNEIKGLNRDNLKEHHLYADGKFSFSEVEYILQDVIETGLYKKTNPLPIQRDSDYLLELDWLLKKIGKQGKSTTFNPIKGSKILQKNEMNITRLDFLAKKVQIVLDAKDIRTYNLTSQTNEMVLCFRKIVNNSTGRSPISIPKWDKAFSKLKTMVASIKADGISVPVK